MTPREISGPDLMLGDVLQLWANGPLADGPWSFAVVTRLFTDSGSPFVEFFRPYVKTGDLIHSGRLTPYIGVETWTAFAGPLTRWKLVRRKDGAP